MVVVILNYDFEHARNRTPSLIPSTFFQYHASLPENPPFCHSTPPW